MLLCNKHEFIIRSSKKNAIEAVSGKILLEKWIFSGFSEEKGSCGWGLSHGGAAFTQKSERLSGQIQKTSFQIWDLTFCSPRAALLALERSFCSGEEFGVFRVNLVF